MAERIHIFDTTLRDGAQTRGVDFSVDDKRANARALHGLANRSDQQANRGARLCPDAAPDTRAVSPANVPSDAGTEPAADGLDANARAVARPDIGPGRFVGDAQGPRRD